MYCIAPYVYLAKYFMKCYYKVVNNNYFPMKSRFFRGLPFFLRNLEGSPPYQFCLFTHSRSSIRSHTWLQSCQTRALLSSFRSRSNESLTPLNRLRQLGLGQTLIDRIYNQTKSSQHRQTVLVNKKYLISRKRFLLKSYSKIILSFFSLWTREKKSLSR